MYQNDLHLLSLQLASLRCDREYIPSLRRSESQISTCPFPRVRAPAVSFLFHIHSASKCLVIISLIYIFNAVRAVAPPSLSGKCRHNSSSFSFNPHLPSFSDSPPPDDDTHATFFLLALYFQILYRPALSFHPLFVPSAKFHLYHISLGSSVLGLFFISNSSVYFTHFIVSSVHQHPALSLTCHQKFSSSIEEKRIRISTVLEKFPSPPSAIPHFHLLFASLPSTWSRATYCIRLYRTRFPLYVSICSFKTFFLFVIYHQYNLSCNPIVFSFPSLLLLHWHPLTSVRVPFHIIHRPSSNLRPFRTFSLLHMASVTRSSSQSTQSTAISRVWYKLHFGRV